MNFTLEIWRRDGEPMTWADYIAVGISAAIILFALYVLAMAFVKAYDATKDDR